MSCLVRNLLIIPFLGRRKTLGKGSKFVVTGGNSGKLYSCCQFRTVRLLKRDAVLPYPVVQTFDHIIWQNIWSDLGSEHNVTLKTDQKSAVIARQVLAASHHGISYCRISWDFEFTRHHGDCCCSNWRDRSCKPWISCDTIFGTSTIFATGDAIIGIFWNFCISPLICCAVGATKGPACEKVRKTTFPSVATMIWFANTPGACVPIIWMTCGGATTDWAGWAGSVIHDTLYFGAIRDAR